MKIGIDCRLWNQTGVGRYIRNLVNNLDKADHKNDYVLFMRHKDAGELKIKNSKFNVVEVDAPWHSLNEQLVFPKILNSQNLDLMHFTYFSIPFFYNKPFVVTIHDLIVNRYNTGKASTLPLPIYMIKRAGYHAVLSNAVYRSKKIIVPSNSVKNDLLQTYRGLKNEKIEVIYEGGFDGELKVQNAEPKIEGKYILRVGNFYPHKNVENLLLAFKNFLFDTYDNHDVKLVLVGRRDYFYSKIANQVHLLNIAENVIFIESPKDEELLSLYRNAIATIVPSFMEGFSLTAVEAMSLSSVVVVSDIPVHREICGDAAIYCNPKDVNDIKQKIDFACSLIDSSRKELSVQAAKQAKKFSWEKMAENTLKIYNSN